MLTEFKDTFQKQAKNVHGSKMGLVKCTLWGDGRGLGKSPEARLRDLKGSIRPLGLRFPILQHLDINIERTPLTK